MKGAEMPRKRIVLLIVAGTIFVAGAARPALAQPRPDTRPVKFYIDFGYANLFSQPKWVNLGPELEIRLGRLFSFNPDVSVWIAQNFRGSAKIVPGATVNMKLGSFFVGGGAVRRIAGWREEPIDVGRDRGWLLPKAQVGYLMGPTRLTVSVLFVGAANDIAIGLTLATGIGRRPRGSED
jgi:hypothetical protein